MLQDRDAELMAESINLLTKDEAMNVEFGIAGRRRYESHFATSSIETEFFQALANLN